MISTVLLAAVVLDHSAWDGLLRTYVTPESLVRYESLAASGTPALDAYLETLARPWPAGIGGDERRAALINAYNALTVRWILRHYPVDSVWKTKRPFSQARHKLDGRSVSLDAIEKELRSSGDPRIHAALVCAARSCPPLRRQAYTGAQLDAQLAENTRAWISTPSLNEFSAGRAFVSKIFDWYKQDFSDLPGFLKQHGAPPFTKLTYKDYHWGLNDAGGRGAKYGGVAFYRDYLLNK